MPQAPGYLQAEFHDDAAALVVISSDFKVSRGGMIYPAVEGYKPTERQYRAIDYLIMEWDYGYSSIRPTKDNHG